MKNKTILLAAAIAAWLIPDSAQAQSTAAETRSVQELATERPMGISLRPSVRYAGASGLNGAGLNSGRLAVAGTDLELGYTYRREALMLNTQAMYGFRHYDFSRLAAPQPFGSSTNSFGLASTAIIPIEGKWGAFVIGSIETAADSRGSFGRGFEYSLGFGPSYQFSPDLQIRAGVMIGTRLEDSLQVLPIVAIDWRITQRLRLQTANGARLSFALTEDNLHSLDAGISYNRESFSTGPASVAVSQRWFAGSFGYTWRPSAGFSIRPFVEMQFDRRWELLSGKVTQSSFKANTSIGGGLQGSITW